MFPVALQIRTLFAALPMIAVSLVGRLSEEEEGDQGSDLALALGQGRVVA